MHNTGRRAHLKIHVLPKRNLANLFLSKSVSQREAIAFKNQLLTSKPMALIKRETRKLLGKNKSLYQRSIPNQTVIQKFLKSRQKQIINDISLNLNLQSNSQTELMLELFQIKIGNLSALIREGLRYINVLIVTIILAGEITGKRMIAENELITF